MGNLPLFPGIFPDQMAPSVRSSLEAGRELPLARSGVPEPPRFGGQPVTKIRNVSSPHWRGWLKRAGRVARRGNQTRPKRTGRPTFPRL